MQIAWTPELILKAGELGFMALASWVGLKVREAIAEVRTEQLTVKAELLAKQNELEADFNAKHAENKQGLAVHVARDEQQFENIGESLDRIESKLDRRNGHGD